MVGVVVLVELVGFGGCECWISNVLLLVNLVY